MPPRNKRKRPVKAEQPDSDSKYEPTSDEQAPPKRVKAEVKAEVKVEELSDDDFAIVLSDCELSDSSDRQVGRPVRRSAGGRPPRRCVDVATLYEEAGVGQLARSLGQVVKEEAVMVAAGSDDVKVEARDRSPLRVSDCVRRAAAARAEQLLRGVEGDKREALAGEGLEVRTEGVAELARGKQRYFTAAQRAVLRAQFDVDPYPGRATKEELSEQLGVAYMSVHNWFRGERERRGTRRSNYDNARKKCVFGFAVYDELAAQFERNPRPDLATRKALAVKTGASLKQISSWFEKRRASQRDLPRTVEITLAHRTELEAVFQADSYPDKETRTTLAEKIGCSMKQITQWFYGRRRRAGITGSKAELARRTSQFGPEGYDRLVAQFESGPYPAMETRAALAAELGWTVGQVTRWFNNRRSSEGINEGNSARYQCALGPAAYDELVAAFEAEPFPDIKTREVLATKTGGAQEQITNWFKRRRLREGIQSRSDNVARSLCKFGAEVYDELVAQFEADPFPGRATVKMLAQKAGGTPQQIKNWYSYERMDSTTARVAWLTKAHPNRFRHRRQRLGIQRSNEEGARLACKFGPKVYDQLVAQFEVDPYPSTDVIKELAASAGATASQMRNWFESRRRSKHRRQKQK